MVQVAGEAEGCFASHIAAMPAAEPLRVLKFGSSVLRSIADLPRVAGEFYQQRRRAFAVVAVVSALEGETDRDRGHRERPDWMPRRCARRNDGWWIHRVE